MFGENESFDPTETRAADEPLAGWEYDHNRFTHALERRGFRITREVPEQQRVWIDVRPGVYRLAAGFESPSANTAHLLYGNNRPEKQHIPVRVDVDGPRFREFCERFIANLHGKEIADLESLVHLLDDTMRRRWNTTSADEDIRSVEDLFTQKETVCEGMSEIGGLTLPRLGIPNIHVAKMRGTSHQIAKRRPHDIGHMWLRVQYEEDAVLWDPYYRRITDIKDFAGSPFAQYEVEAGFMPDLMQSIGMRRMSGQRTVETIHNSHEMYMTPQVAADAQVNGRAEFQITVNGGELMLEQGSLVRRRTPENYHSARILNPLLDFKQMGS